MKKRTLLILMCILTLIALCFAFASCGNNSDSTGTSESSSSSNDNTDSSTIKPGDSNDNKPCTQGGSVHNWDDWITTNATCVKAGQKIRFCSDCGTVDEQTSYAEMFPATGNHSWDFSGTCQSCGTNICEIGQHNYGSWITSNPTCAQPEKRYRVCNFCADEYVDPNFMGRPATGMHAYVDYICAVCGEADPNKPNCTEGGTIHKWEYQIGGDVAATCEAAGKQTYRCALCNLTDIRETIPAYGHTWGSVKMGVLQMERTCTRFGCGKMQTRPMKNLSLSAELIVEGGGWGLASGSVNNGNWNDGGTAFNGTGSFELILTTPSKVDQIAVACSSGSFEIEVVTNKSNGEYIPFAKGAGEGNSKEAAQVFALSDYLDDDDVLIISVKVTQTTPKTGEIQWGEIAIGQIDETKDWQ